METRSLEGMLAEHPFCRDLGPHFVELVAGCAAEVRFDPGTILFRQGEDAERFYLIRHGRVAVEVPTAGSGALTIQTLSAGDVLGWSWLIPPYRWHFDARAVDLTRALALDGTCLRTKCESDPALGYEFLKRFLHILEDRLQATRLQLIDVYGSSAREFRKSAPKGSAA
jgi:CRP/FNR family cyclic AMP-dependent transcriptional regulator